MLSSILLYGSETCGYNKFNKCDQIQSRAIRFFLGIHKGIPFIVLDLKVTWDWFLFLPRCACMYLGYMMRLWNRLI